MNDLCNRSLTGDILASTGNMDASIGDMDTSTGDGGAWTSGIDSSSTNTDSSIGNIDSSIGDIDTRTRPCRRLLTVYIEEEDDNMEALLSSDQISTLGIDMAKTPN